MAEKAGLLWPRLPRKRGRGQACQALPGRIFLVSLAKNPESPAWPGFARLAGFLTGLLMQGWVQNRKQEQHSGNSVDCSVIASGGLDAAVPPKTDSCFPF